MEKLSESIKKVEKPKENPEKQWYLRNWYVAHYHCERFYLIEMIEKEELEMTHKEENKRGYWMLPHEIRSMVNKERMGADKPYFNWPGFNEAKQQNYGVGIQAVESLREKIKYYIDRAGFNEQGYDIDNWHIIDNMLFENRGQINYRTIRVEPAKASKLL